MLFCPLNLSTAEKQFNSSYLMVKGGGQLNIINLRALSPLQGFLFITTYSQGDCPSLSYITPSGYKNTTNIRIITIEMTTLSRGGSPEVRPLMLRARCQRLVLDKLSWLRFNAGSPTGDLQLELRLVVKS